MARVRMTSDLKPPHGKSTLTARTIVRWASSIPENAEITGTTRQAGDMRETYSVFGGLHAVWTEDRPDLDGAEVSGTVTHLP